VVTGDEGWIIRGDDPPFFSLWQCNAAISWLLVLFKRGCMRLVQRSALRFVGEANRDSSPGGLVASIAAGDEDAFARFHEATSGLLFGLLLRILGDTATADEVLVGVYTEVRQYAAGYDKNGESLLAWLLTITHRRALEHLCSSSEDEQFLVSVGLATTPAPNQPHRVVIRKSAHRKLFAATLSSLSPQERKMIELAYFSRMTPLAIAVRLGQSTENVRAGLQGGILRLYQLFRNHSSLSEA